MATFSKAPKAVADMAAKILEQFATHRPLLDAKVRIDLIFAHGKRDDDGNLVGDALKLHGVRAFGVCRIVSLKDRTKGMGDAEISLDADWWDEKATPDQQEALLDHELHHIAVKMTKANTIKEDDLGRPLLRLRKHDYQFGWFNIIAERHAEHSLESCQFRQIVTHNGQMYWPELFDPKATAQKRLEIVKQAQK